ncbi:MAG: adenosylcobinamide-GDP ribazoletransferase [Rhodocyclaceae bacterium]|nr:adenosylcobinamide-GDP ribazoletransferase [Rhodocyclaceae bacterium]
MDLIRREASYFFAALRFFTRLPVPAWVGHSQDQLDHAARYFSIVGLVVGTLGALATWLAAWALPLSLAILLGMAATLLVTGAFHEDGFADSCDGFGGGWDKAQVLTIMKDSRLGSYGAIGIMLLLLAKWNALMELEEWLLVGLLAAHASSRAAAATLIYALDYVRDEDSKAKPLARRMSFAELALVWSFGFLPCLLLPWQNALCAVLLQVLVVWAWARYSVRRIGGYTGDVLGATQQLGELAFYCGLLCVFTW